MRQRALGPSDPAVGETLNNQAAIWLQMRDWQAGEAALRQALAIHRAAYGNDHPEVAITLSNLGVALERQGNLEEAETVLREALAIRQRLLGRAHPEIADTLSNLSQVQRRRGDLAAARASLAEAVAIDREALGQGPSDRRRAARQSRRGGAGRQRLRPGGGRVPGDAAHPRPRRSRRELPGRRSRSAGSASWPCRAAIARAAEPLLREALAIRQREWDPGSWQVAESESLLGGCLAAQGRTREARVLLERSTQPCARASAKAPSSPAGRWGFSKARTGRGHMDPGTGLP